MKRFWLKILRPFIAKNIDLSIKDHDQDGKPEVRVTIAGIQIADIQL